MLVYATLTKWEGKPGIDTRITNTAGTPILLQGSKIQGIETRATTKSKFMYTDTLDIKEKASYVEAEEAVSTLIADLNATWQTVTLPMVFYTGNEVTGATFTRYILGESIVYAYQDHTYPATKSWVVYMEGGKRITALTPYSLKQIRELGNTGDLTTT